MISLFSLFYFFVCFFVWFSFSRESTFFAVENGMGPATLVTFELPSDVSLRML